jgi:crotonobetaine/carnitine-CoA ligase
MRVIDVPFEDRVMPQLLRDQARHIPDATFVKFEDELFSFAQTDRLVDQYARGLVQLGVERGITVAVMMDNGPEFVWLTFAISRVGGILVPINTAYRGTYLSHVVSHSQAKVLVIEAQWLDRVLAIEDKVPELQTVVVLGGPEVQLKQTRMVPLEDLVVRGSDDPSVELQAPDPFMIMYTSGTTGRSKGAIQSYANWYDATISSLDRRDIREDDVFFVTSPMFHSAAWVTHVFCALCLGLPVALDRRFSVSEFWNRVKHYKATQLFTMSAQHMWLYNAPPRDDDADNTIRVWSPVPLAPELHETFKERFGIERLWFTYGQTEALMITVTDPLKPLKPGSAGFERKEVEIAILDDFDRPLPANEIGEICVRTRSPHTIFSGYWRNPEATVNAWGNLWYHTGDLGKKDDDGEIFFLDRKADYLRVRGERISSFEVEDTIGTHPAVAEVAAFAVRPPDKDATWEDEIKICIVPSEGATLDNMEFTHWLAERLPYFAVPRYIQVVASLPRTPTNRVQKFMLRQDGINDETWDRVAAGMTVTRRGVEIKT